VPNHPSLGRSDQAMTIDELRVDVKTLNRSF
jgi:hypothetical protein